MKPFLLTLTLLTLFISPTLGQLDYDKDYFRSPVNHPIYLAGTFGELRPNHFHAGIDIKSKKGSAGDELFAAADGYAYRVKVSKEGYGRTLYLRHDNGLITVYAHMSKYAKSIEDWIKNEQYIKEDFLIERFPEVDQFRFKKGDYIGKMGMTGRTYGPHLHFEVRNEAEEPINPLYFNFNVADTRKPIINQIKFYSLNDKKETLDTKTYDTKKRKNGTYHLGRDTISLGAWRTGIAIKTYDLMNSIKNWNGVYKVEMYVDDVLQYNYVMDKIPFSQTRYINAHMDYAEQRKKSYFNRCYMLPGNKLEIYDPNLSDGVIKLYKDKKQKVRFVVEDIVGNTSSIEFWLKRGEINEPTKKVYNYLLPFADESIIKNESSAVHFPEGSFYENVYLNLEESKETDSHLHSPVLSMKSNQPVHKYSKVSLKPYAESRAQTKKYYIAQCNKEGKYEYCGHEIEADFVTAKVRSFGDYAIMVDTIPPTIEKVYFRQSMKGSSYMRFKAKDNVSSIDYRAEVDGQWVLMSHDPKTNILEYRFDKYVQPGQHELNLYVWDQNGNTQVFNATFVR